MCQMEEHGRHHGTGSQDCGCGDAHGEVMKGRHEPMLQPILLLLLYEKSAHGYELHERLAAFGLDVSVEPTTVYRYLRRFEELGLVASQWETQDAGPARRLYESLQPADQTCRHFLQFSASAVISSISLSPGLRTLST